jgi:hypothetical protein
LKQQTYFTSAKAAIWSQKTLISTDFCDQINLVVMLAKDYTQSLAITKSHTHTAKKKYTETPHATKLGGFCMLEWNRHYQWVACVIEVMDNDIVVS